jgi:hypothetical protein
MKNIEGDFFQKEHRLFQEFILLIPPFSLRWESS